MGDFDYRAGATDIGSSYIAARSHQSVNSAPERRTENAQTKQSKIRRSKSFRVMVGFCQMILVQSRSARRHRYLQEHACPS
jgi:hypothetical protein